jgi:soluble lytic murein transglycosylase
VASGQDAAPQADSAAARLAPTAHPALPDSLSQYWLVPDRARPNARTKAEQTALDRLARGVKLVSDGDFAAGLPLVNGAAVTDTVLAGYAQYYAAVALIGLSRFTEADETLAALAKRDPDGYLQEAIPQRIADAALGRNDADRAVDVLDDLSDEVLTAKEAVLLQLARAAERDRDIERALEVYRQIYYELPTAPEAADADEALRRLETVDRIPPDRFKRDLQRAEKLFDARRWAQARAAFEPLLKVARDDDAERVQLRMAEADYYLDRFRAARDRLVPLLDDSPDEAEVRFFHLSATRGLGDHATYVRLATRLVEDHANSRWAEETLNNLASHYIIVDDDAEADRVFRQLVRSFPKSRYGDRAAWRIGWRAYRAGNFREAAETFEQAAAAFPRADYRPAWLYWSGRAHAHLNEPEIAASRYVIAIADYENSYYGRLAKTAMAGKKDVQRAGVAVRQPAAEKTIPTDPLIRELIALQLYDDALREVQYAQRKWGDSAQLQATAAFVRYSQGAGLKAEERFTAIRGAITTMRRAYPQFMAAGGGELPPDVLRIIFPLDYWPLITKYSKQHGLDPYLIAALMAQESTFTAEIRSSANAIGLMQLIPSTGRRYARKLNLRNFSTRLLTNPETNVRLGTFYFKDLMDRFGGAHYALAGYNAGEQRVDRWIAERPPLPADEFVEEIPFSETQNYVKRILGTAEDYRHLYGGGRLDPNAPLSASATPVPAPARPAAAPAGPESPARPASSPPSRNAPSGRPARG